MENGCYFTINGRYKMINGRYEMINGLFILGALCGNWLIINVLWLVVEEIGFIGAIFEVWMQIQTNGRGTGSLRRKGKAFSPQPGYLMNVGSSNLP